MMPFFVPAAELEQMQKEDERKAHPLFLGEEGGIYQAQRLLEQCQYILRGNVCLR